MDTIELKNKIEEIISNHCGWSVIDDTMINELVELLGDKKEFSNKPVKGICVDGGTEGNPGPCFYRGVDIEKYKDKIRKITNDFPHLNEKGEYI